MLKVGLVGIGFMGHGHLDQYLRLMKEGLIEGIVICSNCIADLGIEAVEWTRNWLIEHRDDEI